MVNGEVRSYGSVISSHITLTDILHVAVEDRRATGSHGGPRRDQTGQGRRTRCESLDCGQATWQKQRYDNETEQELIQWSLRRSISL